MPTLTRYALLCAILTLSGCVTMTSPVPIGPDAWMMGLGARGGFESDAALLAKTIQAAGEFCATQGRRIEVTGTSAGEVQGWTPQSNAVILWTKRRIQALRK